MSVVKRLISCSFLVLLLVVAVTKTDADDFSSVNSFAAPTLTPDPYEHFNRAMFKFDMKLDDYVLKPVGRTYNKILPQFVREHISNFYTNIGYTTTVVNDVLQANFYQATSDSWRLLVNTTIGGLGFFDPATSMGLSSNSEDFGLTFAKWGYTSSNYLVLPFFGPSTVRDTLGMPPGYFTSIYPYIPNLTARNSLYGLGVVSKNAELLTYQNFFQQAAIDQYVFVRSAYLQQRNHLINRNNQLNDPYTASDLQTTYKPDPLLSQT